MAIALSPGGLHRHSCGALGACSTAHPTTTSVDEIHADRKSTLMRVRTADFSHADVRRDAATARGSVGGVGDLEDAAALVIREVQRTVGGLANVDRARVPLALAERAVGPALADDRLDAGDRVAAAMQPGEQAADRL